MSIIISSEDGEIEKKFRGSGTKEDPIIIDSTEELPVGFEIFESKQYITMKNCNLNYLGLYNTENFTIENCKFETLELYHNINITIKNSEIYKSILSQSKNCQIENSKYTHEFCIFKSHNNSIRNCVFENFFSNPDYLSRGNTLENNKIHEKDLEELKDIDLPLKHEKNTFLIDERFGWSLVECKGTGTENDPFIIGPQKDYSQVVYIKKIENILFLIISIQIIWNCLIVKE